MSTDCGCAGCIITRTDAEEFLTALAAHLDTELHATDDQVTALARYLTDFVDDYIDDTTCSRAWHNIEPDGDPVQVGPISGQDRANLEHELNQAAQHAAWLGRPPLLEEIAQPVLAAYGVEVGE